MDFDHLEKGVVYTDEVGYTYTLLSKDDKKQNDGTNCYYKAAKFKKTTFLNGDKVVSLPFHEKVDSQGEVIGYHHEYLNKFKKI